MIKRILNKSRDSREENLYFTDSIPIKTSLLYISGQPILDNTWDF